MNNSRRKKPIRLPTDREVSLLLSVIRYPRNLLIFVLGLKLGLRAAEIANLRLSDINLEKRTISFIGKGSKSAVLPLTDEVMSYLERALKVRPTNLKHDFVIWDVRNPNKGISRFGIYYLVVKYGRKAGVKLWPHLLRHKFGTDFFKKSGDLKKTKDGLRHSRLATTIRYTHTDVEDQREDFALLDSRHWLLRFLSKFKPPIPGFLLEKAVPVFIGDTVGRKDELAKLSANLSSGIHTVLCGEKGAGSSHLLRQLRGEGIYHLEGVKPARERLVELCEQMQKDGALPEIPKGKGTSTLLKALIEAMEDKHYTLVIDSLSDITKDGIPLVRKLKEHFTIFTSIEVKHRSKLKDIFFGSHDTIEVKNLSNEDAFRLADAASVDLPTTLEGREVFLKRVVAESKGNPKAIMEVIEKERKRGRVIDAATEISHEAMQEPLPATPFLSTFLVIAVVSRYGASTVGLPDWKIIFITAIIVTAILILIDRVLKQDIRQ